MKQLFRYFRRPLTVCLAIVVCMATPAASWASHAWGPYHWARTSNPFTLKLGNNTTTSDWVSRVQNTSLDWNTPVGDAKHLAPDKMVNTMVVAGKRHSRRCSAVAGTTQVCNGDYGTNGWLGVAQIWIDSSNHIQQGTTKMNDTYFNTTFYNTGPMRQHVMCQEVGHTFGLGHQSTDGSSLNTCMDYFSNTGANASSLLSTKPNYHDFEQLMLTYSSHLDSTTTVAATPALGAATSAVTDDPKSWGELISQSANGHSSVYERSSNGIRILTHVSWTNEAASVCSNPKCDHRFDRH